VTVVASSPFPRREIPRAAASATAFASAWQSDRSAPNSGELIVVSTTSPTAVSRRSPPPPRAMPRTSAHPMCPSAHVLFRDTSETRST
jgi:hypothetical protein